MSQNKRTVFPRPYDGQWYLVEPEWQPVPGVRLSDQRITWKCDHSGLRAHFPDEATAIEFARSNDFEVTTEEAWKIRPTEHLLFQVYFRQPDKRVLTKVILTKDLTSPFAYGVVLADVVKVLANAMRGAGLHDGERRMTRNDIVADIRKGLLAELENPTDEPVKPS